MWLLSRCESPPVEATREWDWGFATCSCVTGVWLHLPHGSGGDAQLSGWGALPDKDMVCFSDQLALALWRS